MANLVRAQRPNARMVIDLDGTQGKTQFNLEEFFTTNGRRPNQFGFLKLQGAAGGYSLGVAQGIDAQGALVKDDAEPFEGVAVHQAFEPVLYWRTTGVSASPNPTKIVLYYFKDN